MLYMIEILCRNDKQIRNIACERNGLFDILFILQESEYVCQFKVSQGAMTCNEPREFGFGNLEKWVNKFNYNLNK